MIIKRGLKIQLHVYFLKIVFTGK